MSVAAIATEIIREGTAFSVSDRGVDTNRRNPAPSLQDDVHRDDTSGRGDTFTAPPASQRRPAAALKLGAPLRPFLVVLRDVDGRAGDRLSARAHLVYA
jgi:hypothetical protein